MTEKALQSLYRRYNKKFFDGKLPADIPIKFVDMSATNQGGLCTTVASEGLVLHVIYLDSTFREYDNLLKLFLLHEMVHVQIPALDGQDPHGKEFDDGMMRLCFRGALKGLW